MRALKRSFRKKLRSSRGETITETLVSLLIITLAMTMLAGSIVSAARINRKVSDADTAFRTGTLVTSGGTVTLKHKTSTDTISGIRVYRSTNGYVYYEPAD